MLEGILSQAILLLGVAGYGWIINILMRQCYESNTPFRSGRRQLAKATLLFHVAMFCWTQFSLDPPLWITATLHAAALLAAVVSSLLLMWLHRRQGVLQRTHRHRKTEKHWMDSWRAAWTPTNAPLHSHHEHSASVA